MPYTIHYTIKEGCLSELKITASSKEEADKCTGQIKKMGFKVLKVEES